MKPEQITKPDKKNNTTSKKLTMTSCRRIMTSSALFRFMGAMKQSGTEILSAWCMILKFLLINTFSLTKSDNGTKKSLTQLSYYCIE